MTNSKKEKESLDKVQQFIHEYEKRMLDGSALPVEIVDIAIQDLLAMAQSSSKVARA